jgi:hypothetical protein
MQESSFMKPLYIFVAFFFVSFLNISRSFADQSNLSGLSNLFGQSKATEALASLDNYKIQIEACLSAHPTTAYTSCAGLSPFPKTTYFSYAFDPNSLFVDNATYSMDNYTIIATPIMAAGAANEGQITITRNNGIFTCQGTGPYTGAC